MDDLPVRPGDVLAGKYVVERVLGAGGMGVVLAAHQLGLDRAVAVKLMLPGRLVGPEALARFLREARATARLRSHHVARVFDVGTTEAGAPYIVFELLEGIDLGALLEQRGPLPVEEAVEYVLQACEGVAEAHAAGLVHRDLKPSNLFLTANADGSPCVKVVDFGITKETGSSLALTETQQGIGSPLYMSPEQMQRSRDVDVRADIWSMGVVLHELLTGGHPFQADSLQHLCAKVFFAAPTPPTALRPDLPAALEVVILRCLEKEPDARWRSIDVFAAALGPFAPPRAAPYVDRVAAVLRWDRRTSQPGAARAEMASRPSIGDPVPQPQPLPLPQPLPHSGTLRLGPPAEPPAEPAPRGDAASPPPPPLQRSSGTLPWSPVALVLGVVLGLGLVFGVAWLMGWVPSRSSSPMTAPQPAPASSAATVNAAPPPSTPSAPASSPPTPAPPQSAGVAAPEASATMQTAASATRPATTTTTKTPAGPRTAPSGNPYKRK